MKRTTIALAALTLASSFALPSSGSDRQRIIIWDVEIGCKNPGSHQDVEKSPELKNTTGKTIPKGTTLRWKATDGDTGTVKLTSSLAPNGTVAVSGSAGNAYSCTANFSAGPPDLQPAGFVKTRGTLAKIRNNNTFFSAGASAIKVEVVECGSLEVLSSAVSGAKEVAAGGFGYYPIPALQSDDHFYRITADATGKVREGDEKNNVWANTDQCIK